MSWPSYSQPYSESESPLILSVDTPCYSRRTAAIVNSLVNCLGHNLISQLSVQWILRIVYRSFSKNGFGVMMFQAK